MKNKYQPILFSVHLSLLLMIGLSAFPTHFLRAQCTPEITVTIIQPSNHGCWDGKVIVDCASPSGWPGAWLIWPNGYQMVATESDYNASLNVAYHYEWHGLPAGNYWGNVWGNCGPYQATQFTAILTSPCEFAHSLSGDNLSSEYPNGRLHLNASKGSICTQITGWDIEVLQKNTAGNYTPYWDTTAVGDAFSYTLENVPAGEYKVQYTSYHNAGTNCIAEDEYLLEVPEPQYCSNFAQWPQFAYPLNNNSEPIIISDCTWEGDYSEIPDAVAGMTLRFTSTTPNGIITIRSGTPDGPVLAAGTTPLTFDNTFTGPIYAHWNLPGCASIYTYICRTTTVQCLNCAPPLLNDVCNGAIPIGCGETVMGTTYGARVDFPGMTECGTMSFFPAQGVWYTFIGTGSNVTLSLCGSSFDTKMSIYTGSCGELSCVESNDDFCALQSQVNMNTISGATYYVLVYGDFIPHYGAFSLQYIDNTAPTITCPVTQTLIVGTGCTASLPDYTNLATTSDNCAVQSVTQSPVSGTLVSGAGNMTVTLTVTDINGLTNSCSFTVTKEDNTPPNITCPDTQSLALDTNCTAALPDYTGLADTGDGCGIQGIAQSPAAGTTVSGAGNMNVTLTVTDVNGLTNSCTFTVTKVDNIAPTIQCFNSSLTFNGEASIALSAAQLAVVSDNCGVQSVQFSPTLIDVIQLGQTVPVTVIATDINGNPSTCTAQVSVGGLPNGWSENQGGIGCAGSCNNFEYNQMSGMWTGTSTGAFYGAPFNSDVAAFAQRSLCGNGSITARVTSINGGGWAGVVMREGNAPGAKKVQLMTNLGAFNRREYRIETNGNAYPQQFSSVGRYWLRIVRAGNQFAIYTSPNGMAWFLIGSQNIIMANCIQIGLVATNFTANSTVTATFSGVSFIGNNGALALPGSVVTELAAHSSQLEADFNVYPNPTGGELNVDLTQYIGRSVRLEVYSLQGKLLQFSDIDEVQDAVEQLDMSQFENGMYFVKVRSVARNGISHELPEATRRVVLTRG